MKCFRPLQSTPSSTTWPFPFHCRGSIFIMQFVLQYLSKYFWYILGFCFCCNDMVDNRQLWKALHSLFDRLIRNEIVFFHVICYIVQLSVPCIRALGFHGYVCNHCHPYSSFVIALSIRLCRYVNKNLIMIQRYCFVFFECTCKVLIDAPHPPLPPVYV